MPDVVAQERMAVVRDIEERAFNAWPALQTLIVDGWLLRFAEGYTKRANSLNAWQPEAPIDSVLSHAAPIYAKRGLQLIARLSPLAGPGVDAALASRGWLLRDETLVMTARLSQPVAAPSTALSASVRIAAKPEASWLAGFAAANKVPAPRRAIHDRMLAAIPPPAAFATLESNGQPAAWGLAVVERGMVGLFDIVTAPTARRQGAARHLVASLLDWARAEGATAAYLQVVATNTPALQLYAHLGFAEAYRYHYRIARSVQPPFETPAAAPA